MIDLRIPCAVRVLTPEEWLERFTNLCVLVDRNYFLVE